MSVRSASMATAVPASGSYEFTIPENQVIDMIFIMKPATALDYDMTIIRKVTGGARSFADQTDYDKVNSYGHHIYNMNGINCDINFINNDGVNAVNVTLFMKEYY